MKNSNIFILFAVFAATILHGQGPVSALFQGPPPDSIVQIKTVLPGMTEVQTLTVEVTDGWAKMEGDILLGPIEKLRQPMATDRGVVVDGNQYRWPGGQIPYIINSGFTPQYLTLLRQAIDYINGSTHLQVRPLTNGDTRYVVFAPADECASAVGMQPLAWFSPQQVIKLKDFYAPANQGRGCLFNAIIHEIAHAAGLWHEQSREDRDSWVTINWQNIQSGKEYNFDRHISDGIDIGPYDFSSAMHYGPMDFSKNGKPTITAPGGQAFGNVSEYSAGDVAALNWMYPTKACAAFYNFVDGFQKVKQPLHYETGAYINAASNIPNENQITFDAGQSVTLLPGFQATAGCTFRAVIDGCGGAVKSRPGPDEQEWILEAEQHRQALQSAAPTDNQTTNAGRGIWIQTTPNPFATTTNILYELPLAQTVGIELLNAFGVRVAQPVTPTHQAEGRHEYTFEANNLPPGVYFLVLHTGGQKQTRRLVLSR